MPNNNGIGAEGSGVTINFNDYFNRLRQTTMLSCDKYIPSLIYYIYN